MKINVLVCALVCISLGAMGCMNNTFDYPDREADNRVVEERQTFYVGGLIGDDEMLNAHEMCNGPVKSVETMSTVVDTCIGCISFNIYTPNTVNVQCASGEAHNFYLDEDDSVVGHEVYDSESGTVLQSEFKSDHL